MSLSINLHPVDRWKEVHVSVYGAERGSCVIISFNDQITWNSIAFHYGAEAYKEGFIRMMKEAFAKLTTGEEEKKDG